ncbi:MAG: YbaN family protein [Planctomycetota bacterium]|jgi:uncharacterized membrane protein YbaN (DUF454 family)
MWRVSKPRRRVLAYAGIACIGLGSAGAVLPVLPTTPFLLLAAWCFARSNPELGRRLLSKRIFRPYRPYLDGTRPIPARVRWLTIALVWGVVGASAWALSSAWLTVVLVAAALTGSVVVLRWRRGPG